VSAQRLYRLDCAAQTIVLARRGDAPPALLYWGEALAAGADLDALGFLAERGAPHGMLDAGEALDLFPQAARGFSGRPALSVHRADGAGAVRCVIERIEASEGSLAIHLIDRQAGVGVRQTLRLHASGVLCVDARLENIGETPLIVDRFAPCALPCAHDEILRFTGRWAGEWRSERLQLGAGLVASENRTGRSSHHAPPFLIIGGRGFSETQGEALGLHLGWSGDSEAMVERLRDGRVQAQLAPLLAPGEIVLAPGEAFESPTLFAAMSARGLNGLSDRFHCFVRGDILRGRLAERPRPVHFNTWEALYFKHDMARLQQLADEAAALGVERFVLDDGWFAGRDSDRAGLGDWRPDPETYPHGLAPLADYVRARGMQFGLWVEPECASLDSDLLRAHPDWILGPRDQPLGRGQYVLDLARDEVAEAIFTQLDAVLRSCAIDYLKWDCNRDVTHASTHAQTRAVYALIDRVRAAHPRLEIEACASGGARADYEMLKRTDRIWISDCNDPFDRQRQQRAFSLFFPPEIMGAHVGPRASHTNGRIAAMHTRALTALFGHMGVEADLSALSDGERASLKQAIALYKALRPRLHTWRSLRLEHADPSIVAFACADAAGQIVSAAQVDTPLFPLSAPLRLLELDAAAAYSVKLLTPLPALERRMKAAPDWMGGAPLRALGAALMGNGLPLPAMHVGDVLVMSVERT
jgi:alpha-galactosidase